MTTAIPPVSSAYAPVVNRVGDALGAIVRAPFAAIGGIREGVQLAGSGASALPAVSGSALPATWAQTVANFFRSIFSKLFFNGIGNAATGAGISGSGAFTAIGNVVKTLGSGGTLARLGTALGACGPAGWALMAGLGIAGIYGALGGIERIIGEYKKKGEIDNGLSLEMVQSQTFRTISGISGVITAGGGISCLAALAGAVNPAVALGIVATGLVGTFICNKAEEWGTGLTSYHMPDSAPYYSRWFWRLFRNPGATEPQFGSHVR